MAQIATTKEASLIELEDGKGVATVFVMARLLDEKDARIDELERRIATLEAERPCPICGKPTLRVLCVNCEGI